MKQAKSETEEVKRENDSLKGQLVKDTTSLLVMKSQQNKVEQQVATLKKEIDIL